MFGIGGGVLIVPALVYGLGFDQKLEMVGGPPIQAVTSSLLDHYLAGFTQT